MSINENDDSLLSLYHQVDWSIIDINQRDRCGNTPLHLLLKTINSIKAEYCRSLDFLTSISSKETIEYDIEEENEALRCLMTLLDHGANVEYVNSDGKTPLHYTSYLPPSFVLPLLKKKGIFIYFIFINNN